MHVIGGELKGRRLVFVKNPKVRPMTQLVRESLFNIWRERIEGAVLLDLFCGSGSVGIEALSRGAVHVDFVDLAVREAVENVRGLGLGERCSIYRVDALKALERAARHGKSYDIAFVGAPYPYDALDRVLDAFDRLPLLKSGGLLTVEHPKGAALRTGFTVFEPLREYAYGRTVIAVYRALGVPAPDAGAGNAPAAPGEVP